jgi:hypothetical protein
MLKKPCNLSHNCYGPKEAEIFVKYLGCWRHADPYSIVEDRDPAIYKELLQKLIQTNKTRRDAIGAVETLAAKRELAMLK